MLSPKVGAVRETDARFTACQGSWRVCFRSGRAVPWRPAWMRVAACVDGATCSLRKRHQTHDRVFAAELA